MHFSPKTLPALATLVVLGLAAAHRAAAQDAFFPSSTTINYAIGNNAVVGYGDEADQYSQTNGTSPTVNIVAGASVGNELEVYNSSTVNISGGSVAGNGTSTVSDSSTVNISGGSFVSGEYGSRYGGSFDASGNSTLDISGGSFAGNVSVGDNAAANFSGGSVLSLGVGNRATLNVSGGTIRTSLGASDYSTLTITGGTFGHAKYGQTFFDRGGAFTFVGTGLSYTDAGADGSSGEDYRLAGTLQNGQSVDGDIIYVENDAAMFTLVACGSSQAHPLLPSGTSSGDGGTTFTFNNVPTGSWVDPASATAFRFAMTGGSLFTQIEGFPTGFSSPFDVTAGGKDYGLFTPGQSLTFDGAGVSSFLISGINPAVDGSSPTAFPLQAAFNTATADFTMQAVAAPEPSQTAAFGLGVLGLTALALRAQRQRLS